VQETPTVGTSGRGIYNVFSFERFDGSFPKTHYIADGKHQTGVSFTLDKTIHFRSLEFIVYHFGSLKPFRQRK
jgi:hypothetical protein